MPLKHYFAERTAWVDAALDRVLPKPTVRPTVIHRAMRHSVFAGGKRLRPLLCLAAAEACGGNREDAMPAACAVELLHTYSLVHDDLPAMDDDDLRRGHPTCHKVFGEAIGILCGDALLTEAFAVLANAKSTPRHSTASMVRELARAGDSRHMIGGQVLDLEGEKTPATRASLKRIHEAKTAALLTAALRLGAMSANATPRTMEALTAFGHALGLAFQVVDDILDETATTAELGKTAGKDAAAAKATYPSVIGLAKSKREAARLTTTARQALDGLPNKKTTRLREIASHLLERKY